MTAMVTIGCKLPNGLIMRVFEKEEYDVPVMGGGVRKEIRALAKGEPIRLKGNSAPHGQMPAHAVVGGYALTHNVPEAFAKAWFEQNAQAPYVKNNLVFMASKDAEGRAKELKGTRSGLERLDVGTVHKEGRDVPRDPRWPARANPNVTQVQSDKRDAA